ncbi:group I intron-associated PD-(D/E)XK endonuclease [Bacteroides sp.]|uniref:group I intron-associated PD-(D/E)XK endonuclease n=1 Tax=Bacteroides sp. TaxID=29523 RepID=UPI0026074DAB|nr:group I intron-associated PD-(D/E)XK endonuclease [Bacteroides sp.]MDD3039565.1 group I intron-associated PD-(D/E)XK endonuclease [Bacteroides sp.]
MSIDARTLGGFAELQAMKVLISKGFLVSRPIVDNYPYDLICDWHGELKRIQVKATASISENRRRKFESVNGCNRTLYARGSIDYFLCYVVDLDIWYVIPASMVTSKKITVYPDAEESNAKFEIYKERWELLKQ